MEYDVFSSAWLHGVEAEAVAALKSAGELRQYRDKEILYSLGGSQNWLWAVRSGRVKVLVAMNEMDAVLGHIHHPGAWLGEAELVLKTPGLVEMSASGRTDVFRVHFDKYRELATRFPVLWEALARLTAMNQVLAMSAANDLALRTGHKRLAAAILRLSGRRGIIQGAAESSVVYASQQDIAGIANLALSKVSAYLGEFAAAGWIELAYGRVIVLDSDGLLGVIED